MRYVVDFLWTYVINLASRGWKRSKRVTPAEQKALAVVATAVGIASGLVAMFANLAHAFTR